MASRRVLYVDLSPGSGGSIHSLLSLLKRLDRRRWAPSVALAACNPALGRFRALDVPVWPVETGAGQPRPDTWGQRAARHPLTGRLWDRPWFARAWRLARFGRRWAIRVWPQARALARVIQEVQPDLIHLNDALTMSRPGVLASIRTGCPCLCHVRSFDRLGWLDRRLAGRVRRFVYISRAIERAYREQGIRAARGVVIYNGVEMSVFDPAMDRETARRALGLPVDAPVVATFGRLVAWKGQDLFLRAVARLGGRWPGLIGLVVGGEEVYAPDYPIRLRELAEELRIAPRVRFLGHRDDIPRLLAAVDVVVHTPVAPEPFGRVVVEAMAARRPVVATAVGALPELVTDGVDGFLVAAGDLEGVSEALARLLMDEHLRARFGDAGHARVMRDFTAERYAREVMSLYEELVPTTPARSARAPVRRPR